MKARERKRENNGRASIADKRAALKSRRTSGKSLQKLPKNSSKAVRLHNQMQVNWKTKRLHATIRNISSGNLSAKWLVEGLIPGVTKASW